jgi:hypothetical protein
MWQRKAHVGQNRRGDFRSACKAATLIDILTPNPRNSVSVRVIDVSTSGVMLAVPFALAPGTLIRIKMTDAAADGEVRYCTREGDEYHVGVHVEEVVSKGS